MTSITWARFTGAPPQEEQVRTLRVRPADAERRATPDGAAVPAAPLPLHAGIQVGVAGKMKKFLSIFFQICLNLNIWILIFPRKKMFGLYGEASGVSPVDCWPDSETIRQYREGVLAAILSLKTALKLKS